MQVAKYTFQSPSTSPVQVGRLDPSSVDKKSSSPNMTPVKSKTPEQWLKNDVQKSIKTSPTVTNSNSSTQSSSMEKSIAQQKSVVSQRMGGSESREIERSSDNKGQERMESSSSKRDNSIDTYA